MDYESSMNMKPQAGAVKTLIANILEELELLFSLTVFIEKTTDKTVIVKLEIVI